MALSNKQLKDKLRQMARQDVFLSVSLPEREGYQYQAPLPTRRPKRWIPVLAVCAACLAIAVAAGLLAAPFIRGNPLPIASAAESHSTCTSEMPAGPIPIPIAREDSVREHGTYEGAEPTIFSPLIERFQSVEAFQAHLVHYPGFYPNESWNLMSEYYALHYSILQDYLQEDIYDRYDLIWIHLSSPSISYQYIVEGAERTGAETVTVRLTEVGPWAVLNELDSWEFFLLLPKDMLTEKDTVTVEVEQKSLRYQPLLTDAEWEATQAVVGGFDRYYGAYGDCLVIGFDLLASDDPPPAETVCGHVFDYDEQSAAIGILHGGECFSITEAYENGWLTDAEVEEIYLTFRSGYYHTYQGCFGFSGRVIYP